MLLKILIGFLIVIDALLWGTPALYPQLRAFFPPEARKFISREVLPLLAAYPLIKYYLLGGIVALVGIVWGVKYMRERQHFEKAGIARPPMRDQLGLRRNILIALGIIAGAADLLTPGPLGNALAGTLNQYIPWDHYLNLYRKYYGVYAVNGAFIVFFIYHFWRKRQARWRVTVPKTEVETQTLNVMPEKGPVVPVEFKSPDLYSPAESLALAKSYIKEKRFSEAAGLYLGLGKNRKAFSLYARDGNFSRLAEIHYGRGQKLKAAKWFMKAGGKHYEKAAAIYQELKKDEPKREAARAAADWHKHEGRWLNAGEILLKIGDTEQGADYYSRAVQRAAAKKELGEEIIAAARTAAEIYREWGEQPRGAELLALAGDYAAAAELYQEVGFHAQAAENFQRAGRDLDAAAAWEKAGKKTLGLELRAACHEKEGRFNEAGQCWEDLQAMDRAAGAYRKAKNSAKAAEIYKTLNDWPNLTLMCIESGDFQGAAEAAEKNFKWLQAAICWGRAGKPERQAALYEHLGKWVEAAEIYIRLKKLDKAQECLARILPNARAYPEARILMGDILVAQHRFRGAHSCYREALSGISAIRPRPEVWYKLGIVMEEIEDLGNARKLWEAFIKEIPDYKDVAKRFRSLELAQRLGFPGEKAFGMHPALTQEPPEEHFLPEDLLKM